MSSESKRKVSESLRNYYILHPEVREKIRRNMKGNTLKHDASLKHDIYGGLTRREYRWQRMGLNIIDARKAWSSPYCMICGKSDGQMHLDHNHANLRVRGKLCQNCNLLLGLAHDDTSLLKIAINYLEERNW